MTKNAKKNVEAAERAARTAYVNGDYAKACTAYDLASRMYAVEYRMSGKGNMLAAANGCADMARKMKALT